MRYFGIASLWLLGTVTILAFAEVSPRAMEEHQLKVMAREFQQRLGITADVAVAIIEKNERLASVRPLRTPKDTYLLEVDESFLATLTEEEERAIVAHEMGHVWIFTHHPFLQSEPLANEQAERVVPPGGLAKVYKKVWELEGQHGALETFLAQKMGISTAFNSSSATIPALRQSIDNPRQLR
jgi:hypothetical protein